MTLFEIKKIVLEKIDEYTGFISGVSTYFATNLLNIDPMHTNEILNELIIQIIRVFFAGLSAGVAYLVVHYLKTKITKEIK